MAPPELDCWKLTTSMGVVDPRLLHVEQCTQHVDGDQLEIAPGTRALVHSQLHTLEAGFRSRGFHAAGARPDKEMLSDAERFRSPPIVRHGRRTDAISRDPHRDGEAPSVTPLPQLARCRLESVPPGGEGAMTQVVCGVVLQPLAKHALLGPED